jgi:hypothetical protein
VGAILVGFVGIGAVRRLQLSGIAGSNFEQLSGVGSMCSVGIGVGAVGAISVGAIRVCSVSVL